MKLVGGCQERDKDLPPSDIVWSVQAHSHINTLQKPLQEASLICTGTCTAIDDGFRFGTVHMFSVLPKEYIESRTLS